MQIYDLVNVENLRLYEPPLIEHQGENSKSLTLRIFILNTLKIYIKTPYLVEEQGLQNEGMWITFEWGSKEQIR